METKKTGDMILFARVVEAGTITGGSKKIGLERSTVSRRISSLEERLGVTLLERSTRRLRLTEAGRKYYEHCLKVVEASEDAEAAAKGYQVPPQGILNICAAMSEVESFLSRLIAEFMKEYRGLHVELSLTDKEITHVEDGVDLALCLGPINEPNLVTRRLARVSEALWASPEYLAKNGGVDKPQDLTEHACISHGGVGEQVRWQFRRGARSVEVNVAPRFRVNGMLSSRQASVAGLGVSLLPKYLCRDASRRGELRMVLPDWSTPDRELLAVYPSSQFLTRKANAFIEFAAETLRESAGDLLG